MQVVGDHPVPSPVHDVRDRPTQDQGEGRQPPARKSGAGPPGDHTDRSRSASCSSASSPPGVVSSSLQPQAQACWVSVTGIVGRSVIVDEKKENSEIVTMSGSRAWYRIRKPAGWIFGHEPVPEKDFEKTKQYLLLCEIGTRPFRFAPMWVDNGRIVAPLSQTKGPPMQTTSQVRPHPYIEKQIVQDNNYSYPDAVFHTSFVPHISKDLLRSVDISDPAFLQIQELEGLTPDKLRNLFSEIGSKDSKLIQFNGCSGNRFRDVQGSIAFEFDGDTLKLLRISYPEE